MSIIEEQRKRLQKSIDRVNSLVSQEGQEWVDTTINLLNSKMKRLPLDQKHFKSNMNLIEGCIF